jgi:K+-transporting ATPase ATPase C chain
MFDQVLPSLRLAVVTFVLCGLAYPLAVTAMAQTLLPEQANGSLIKGASGAQPLGSRLIGQKFEGPTWFHGRPSSIDYKAESSGASNLGPTSQALADRIATDVKNVRSENPTVGNDALPVDLLTTSGSGLDPDITPASAHLQGPRVARARHLPLASVTQLIALHTRPRALGLFGERRVNVLELNMAIAAAHP